MAKLVGVKVAEGQSIDYSTIRVERRVAQMVRQVAVAEKRGKALTELLERMLRVYVEREHPEMVLLYETEKNE